MLRNLLLSAIAFIVLLSSTPLLAQPTKPGKGVASAAPMPTQYFMVQNHEVVFRKDDQTTVLTKNVVLPSGVRINYQNGLVELPNGKTITLKEGDIVRMSGEIVAGSPVLQASEAVLPHPETARKAPSELLTPASPAAGQAAPTATPRKD